MKCPYCAEQIEDNAQVCKWCQANLAPAAPPPPPSFAAAAPAVGMAPVAGGAVKSSGKATASLVLGIFGMLFTIIVIGIPCAILAIIFGHISLSEIKRSAGRLSGNSKAIAGLVMGYLSIVTIPFILILAAIAIPNFLHARMVANESSAATTMRELNGAVVSYQARCADALPATLQQLGPATPESCETGINVVDNVLAAGVKSGYRFEYEKLDDSHYTIEAIPNQAGNTGRKYFYTDESGVVRADEMQRATAESNPL